MGPRWHPAIRYGWFGKVVRVFSNEPFGTLVNQRIFKEGRLSHEISSNCLCVDFIGMQLSSSDYVESLH